MGVLSDLVIAGAGDAEKIAKTSNPSQAFGGIDIKGIDTVKLESLHEIVLGKKVDKSSPFRQQPVGPDEGPWVFRVPDDFVAALAALDDAGREKAAARWARTDEFKADRWTEASV